jgi:hypothetical protein
MQIFHPELTNVRKAIVAILRTLQEIAWIFGMTALGDNPSLFCPVVFSVTARGNMAA